LDSHGIEQPLVQTNIIPSWSMDVIWCVALAILGFLIVWIIDIISKKNER